MESLSEKHIKMTINGDQPSNIPMLVRCVQQVSLESFDATTASEIELAVMEAVNNAIIHGCRDNKSIHLTMETNSRSLLIHLEYEGVEMDAGRLTLGRESPIFDSDDIETLPEGGMGLPIIHAVMDAVDYSYGQGWSHWTYTKRLGTHRHDR